MIVTQVLTTQSLTTLRNQVAVGSAIGVWLAPIPSYRGSSNYWGM
jgi:hypothetical protein